jgi:hypothetical protein
VSERLIDAVQPPTHPVASLNRTEGEADHSFSNNAES